MKLLEPDDLPGLNWLEIDLTLIAHAAPRRAHPLVVLEAVLKGVFEAARLNARQVKQLWHWSGVPVAGMRWERNTRIGLTVQLFGLEAAHAPVWLEHLHARFAPASGQNFTLAEAGPWRIAHPPRAPDETDSATLVLDFLTPVPLPHRPGTANTALDADGFMRLCQIRLRKLFGIEAKLPPPPGLDTTGWHYWRATHRSQSQHGHPMFIHGCIGPLCLFGPTLTQWQPWLALLAAVGLGERLSFSQGRFTLRAATTPAQPEKNAPVPLRLRRPFVLDANQRGAKLSLANANLIVTPQEGEPATAIPLMRLASMELHAPCQISSGLLEACAEEGIPVLLATPGRPPLIITTSQAEAQRHRTLAAHHAAWGELGEAGRARHAARLVAAKLAGNTLLVRSRYRPGDHLIIGKLTRARTAIDQTGRLAVVRGYEGWAARHYYHWFAQHAARLGHFMQRQHRGQTQDPINLALNYGYALLRHRVATAVRLAGLDPYLGILHEANGRHDALVSDLMEPYRPYIDRLILRLINLRVIKHEDFGEADGVLRLAASGRARLIEAFTRLFDGAPRH
ncbi:MAG: CRISPR-associated endonuclease Cas1, partial [Halothiobacillaceae bacterium]